MSCSEVTKSSGSEADIWFRPNVQRENQRVRSTSDSEAGRIFESGEERNQALSYICEANVRPSNLRSRLQKVSPERNMSCIKDA